MKQTFVLVFHTKYLFEKLLEVPFPYTEWRHCTGYKLVPLRSLTRGSNQLSYVATKILKIYFSKTR